LGSATCRGGGRSRKEDGGSAVVVGVFREMVSFNQLWYAN